ncbi:Crp/Fnr family transcriptional regulator [Paradesertivirga mongoliensis]|uniref:Crp/Fnr family transcriptional regulator n=1 Tax=Paradesertivirga mongoliensis TaxID=2100740 RepID=A0ABW4ZNJ6_9SPHI|nr:Crp/Fnr family transcriptional regulator [Pedobacter mongoliensis]
MYEVFFRKFNEKVALLPEEEEFLKQYLTPKKLRKKQYLLQDDDVCKYSCFVEQGALRAYLVDEKGDEHITAFALEGWTIADLSSFIRQEPATLNIDALEDCELVLISKSAHDELMLSMPKYETYFRILITDAYLALQQRTTNIISLSSEQRYKVFTQMYQSIFQRVPQHMIASFMGLSPETLSRIRGRISKKK